MKRSHPQFFRAAALVVAALGGAAVFMAAPSRGQQAAPALSVAAPATATGPDTRVSLSFAVPAGAHLTRNPRLRVTDAKGQLLELLPVNVTQALPAGAGYRDLHTELYPPGVYQVRLEILYVGADGKAGSALSAPVTLTVGGAVTP
jgi:hypothetical protein